MPLGKPEKARRAMNWSQETCLRGANRGLFRREAARNMAAVLGPWNDGTAARLGCRFVYGTGKGTNMMKKAILVVSFGTSYQDTLDKTIAATERAIAGAFPDWEARRAFTSSMIMKKLRARDGLQIDNVAQAMGRLEDEGYTHVAVQPTHVMHGEEYEKLLAQLEPYRHRLAIQVGEPLLDKQEDYEAVTSALLGWLPQLEQEEALILMGHGPAHFANSAYCQMEQHLQEHCDRIFVATVEGFPTLERVKKLLAARPEIKKLTLAPLMLVAGDHARNDMAGEDDSWKAQLEEAGYSVRCVLQGMGECPAIQQIFVRHCAAAVEALHTRGKLWGVGVGPGDPELLTIKAARVLEQADVILAPDTGKADKTALKIIRDHLNGKTPILVSTPMTRDKAKLDAAYEAAAQTIIDFLEEGKQVAFVTLGDATVYSTYMYIHEKVRARGYSVEVVPGVTSFCAAAARLNISLCQGSEPLLVIPASHDPESLLDVPANKVFMKAGSAILDLKQTLEDRNMLGNAAMVENCTMEDEQVYPDFRELNKTTGYFSLVIVKGERE